MEEEFRRFLKRGGRSEHAAGRIIAYVREFKSYLNEHRNVGLDGASAEDLEAFVAWVEQQPKTSAKGHLWGLGYYYEYIANEDMRHLAGLLREQRIKRRPFPLRKFRGVNPDYVERLAGVGIQNVKQLLKAGKSASGGATLYEETGVPEAAILELVKLSDLARVPGIKGIRARLYHDAGVDTLEKMAAWEPEELREMLAEFVARTGFEGIAPLPAEVRFSIAQAKKLPKIVEW